MTRGGLPSPRLRLLLLVLLALGVFLRLAGLTWGVPPRANAASFFHDEGHVLGMVLADGEHFRTTFGEYEIVRPVYFWRLVGRPLIALGDRLGWNDPAAIEPYPHYTSLRYVAWKLEARLGAAARGLAHLAGLLGLADRTIKVDLKDFFLVVADSAGEGPLHRAR